MKYTSPKKLPAFTLTELMVVLVIIGILMLIALPVFDDLFADTYAIEARNQLKYLQARQAAYYQLHFTYGEELADIGFTQPRTIEEQGDARYRYEIVTAGRSGFTARATAIADFDQDGMVNVWEINEAGLLTETSPD